MSPLRAEASLEISPTSGRSAPQVAIVGGGASGTLTALHLLRTSAARVTVYDPSGRLGHGLAYGTVDRRHLLNVRARHMSAFPDVPSDLINWARDTGRAFDPLAFHPRRDYASYLQDRLAQAASAAPGRLEIVAGRVEDVVPHRSGYQVQSPGRPAQWAESVVLAVGNQAPDALTVGGLPLPDEPWHVADPWRPGWAESMPGDAVVVLVGSGLTAVDVAVSLLAEAPGRRVVMASRHGLLPFGHVDQQSTAWVSQVPGGRLTADGLAAFFTEQVAAAAESGVGWRAVVDGLRASTTPVWRRLDQTERRRFLATYARDWEVRRHRMAPEVAARLADYRRAGRLRVAGGGVTWIGGQGHRGVPVRVGSEADLVTADAVVNCTGPSPDLFASTEPLLATLRHRRLTAPDPLRLGLHTTPDGRLLDPRSEVVPRLYAVGPARKGALWESTAVPEIRSQAAALAEQLSRQWALAPTG